LLILALSTSQCRAPDEPLRMVMDFTGGWQFYLDRAGERIGNLPGDAAWRELDLPHDWSIEGEFSPDHPATTGGGALPGGTGWYRKTFSLDEGFRGKKVFIDFDGDDTTYSLTEVTLRDASGNPISMPLAPGTHAVYFDIPSGTFDGFTQVNPIFIRVRLSSTGGLGATGLAPNGEVEDYQSDFGPNSIALAGFSAGSNPMEMRLAIVTVLLLIGAGIFFTLKDRKQKAAIRIRRDKS